MKLRKELSSPLVSVPTEVSKEQFPSYSIFTLVHKLPRLIVKDDICSLLPSTSLTKWLSIKI